MELTLSRELVDIVFGNAGRKRGPDSSRHFVELRMVMFLLENVGIHSRRMIIKGPLLLQYLSPIRRLRRSKVGSEHVTSLEHHKDEEFSIFRKVQISIVLPR